MSKHAFTVLLSATALVAGANMTDTAGEPGTSLYEHALVRQAPHTETLLTGAPQKTATLKRGRGAKTLALESLGKTGANMMGGPAATLAMPYMENVAAKAAHLGKELVARHGTDANHIEFDTLAGTTAGVSLKPGNVEVLVPLNQYIPSGQAIPEDIRPVLLKLDVSVKDQVRIMAARHFELRQEKKGRLDLKPDVTRIEGEVDEVIVPSSFERLPANVYRIVNTEPLTAGEYAVVFRKKAESARYTTNVVLRTTTQQYQAHDSSGSSLSELMNPANRSNNLAVTATNFMAFDFRILP
jgi:hypothetical protein